MSMICFLFQAEDGIRYRTVTGVQTCALPIFGHQLEESLHRGHRHPPRDAAGRYSPRNSSLMLVFARVLASTCLTITAQYRPYLPSAEGRVPGTTTDPAGTRP